MLKRFLFLSAGVAVIAAAQTKGEVKPPEVDPQRIINASYGFIKDYEPSMTESEYALYEKVVPLAKDNPALVLPLLTGMVSGGEAASPAFEFVLGNVYHAQGQFEEAEAHYRRATERHPEFRRAWSNLGLLYYTTNRFNDAVRCLSRSVELGDRDAGTLSALAYCHYRAGNPLTAELIYMQAVAIDPESTNSIGALIALLLENREYARAEPLARRLVSIKPEETRYWSLYASILASTGRRTEARATLELAASLAVADHETLLSLGDMYADAGDAGRAEAIYQKVDSIAPGAGSSRRLNRVRVLATAGQVDEAKKLFESIPPPRDPRQRADFLRAKADLCSARTEWDLARAALEELLTLAPLDGEALLALGRVARQTGDLSRAELAFADAAKQSGSAYAANLELAGLALNARRYKDCVAYLEAALALERSPVLLRQTAQIKAYLLHDN